MIKRTLSDYAQYIFTKYPVITITGPRQSGKTTLARQTFPDKPYANLENPVVRQFAIEDPIGFLNQYPQGAVLDEIQRAPELLSYLQVIVDDKKVNSLFILTGSRQFELMEKISQSLAGRTALLKLLPFSIKELEAYKIESLDEMLFKGFYPRIYDQDIPPGQAYGDYFETYIERDLRQLVNIKNLNLFQRFVTLCAGRTGQLLNLSNLANDTGISHSTAREWITVLQASYIVYLLPPFYRNIKKRLVKSPKLYFYDVGLACWLCGIENITHVRNHPLRGHLYENMVVIEALKYRYNLGKRDNLNFFRDSSGNEIDVIYNISHNLLPIEIKSGQTITSDYFKGLKKFKKFFPDLPYGQLIIYAGDINQNRTDVGILNIKQFAKFLETVDP
ncbi:MAG: ATP-binding protein [Thermodesulfobacteriota bacterium]|nr:ATP-binding protein [Thermodesulfobacteriota bacterium]